MNNLIQRREFAFVAASAAMLGVLLVGARFANALITTTLSPGESGSSVSELQTFLAMDTSVYPEGLVTGFYGSLTTAAVQRFQCKYSIVCSGSVSSTGYGRVGPMTLAKIESIQGGVSLPPVGVPTIGPDVSAPILSRPTAATTSTSAAIHWSTSESANDRVLYSTVPLQLNADFFAAMRGVSDPTFDTSGDVTITGLMPSTIYYYALQSVDVAGNLQYGIDNWFRTNP